MKDWFMINNKSSYRKAVYAILLAFFCFGSVSLKAQSIRKNYTEMTEAEKTALVNAFYALRGGADLINDLRTFHNNNGSILHFRLPNNPSQDQFLAWHRRMVFELEQAMQEINPNLSIPFWDSVNDQSTSSALWDYDFMGQFNSDWSLNRNLGGNPNAALPTQTDLDNAMAITTWLDFSNNLERGTVHAGAHRWVGGLMPTHSSPGDPIFYLHHSFVDKLWKKWEDTNHNSGYILDPLIRYNGTYTFDGETLPVVHPNDIVDSRALGVFYGENGLAVLDKYMVGNLYNETENFYYQYTIQAGDNFIVPDGNKANFTSVNEIVLTEGFLAESGADFVASIDADATMGGGSAKSRNGVTRVVKSYEGVDWNSVWMFESLNGKEDIKKIINVSPNPFSSYINITLNKKITNGTVEVYDLAGKRLYSKDFQDVSVLNVDRLSNLSLGLYVIKVKEAGREIFSTKIVKQ